MNFSDADLQAKAFEAGSKKEKIDVRIDPRTMRALYYIKNGEILTAPLNPKKTANADFAFMSLDEYKHYRKIKKQIDRKGKDMNLEADIYQTEVNTTIVKNAMKNKLRNSNTKHMREARKIDKSYIALNTSLAERSGISESEDLYFDFLTHSESNKHDVKVSSDVIDDNANVSDEAMSDEDFEMLTFIENYNKVHSNEGEK